MLNAFRYYWDRSPARFLLLVTAVTLTNMLEGIGLGMLLPIIEQIQGKTTPSSRFSIWASAVYEGLSIPWSLETVLAGLCAVFLLKGAATLVIRKFTAKETAALQFELRAKLIDTILGARLSYIQEKKIGEHLSSLTIEAGRAASALFTSVQWLSTLLSMFAFLAVALAISPTLALVALLLAGIAFHPLSFVARRAWKYGQELAVINANLTHRIVEALQAIKLLKSADMQSKFLGDMERLSAGYRDTFAKVLENGNAIQIYGQTIGAVFLAILLVVASRVGIPLAEQGVFLFAFLRLLPSLQQLHAYSNDILANSPGLDQVVGATKAAADAGERRSGSEIVDFQKAIHLDRVSVRYAESDILLDVTMTVRKGETVALVGPSGAGKTTLADVILGLTHVSAGSVTIDDRNLDHISLQSWRRLVAYVPQEVSLFNDSIRNNITWGDPTVTEDRLNEVIRLAQAADFIRDTERGLETHVGDRGVRLSGGQRQRLAIARALLSEPKVLILDEATSALDHENERAIARMIESLKESTDIAILVIAHRVSTVGIADRAYVIREGRVVEEGRWSDLRQNSEGYVSQMITSDDKADTALPS
jgi:subfamily B ATP-binding cassette protein MsbA